MRAARRPSEDTGAAGLRPAARWPALVLIIAWCGAAAAEFAGPLPDFEADRHNVVRDAEEGGYLTPRLPGEVFEWPSAVPVDWNADGLFDLLVGYNLRDPDVIRMVVYLNRGKHGQPAFTGRRESGACFYVEVVDPDTGESRVFENAGYHEPHRSHKFLVHTPAVLDIDGDGLFDILVNEGVYDRAQRRGQWLLHNVGAPGAPRFEALYLHADALVDRLPPGPYVEAMRHFRDAGGRRSFVAVTMLDWDSDGIADFQYSDDVTRVLFGARGDGPGWQARAEGFVHQRPAGGDRFGRIPHIIAADFDGDGVNELLVANAGGADGRTGDGYLSLYVRDAAEAEPVYRLAVRELFSLNGDDNPWLYPDLGWPWIFPEHGWWYPRISPIDFDEDGDVDIVAGWGGGNDQRQVGDRMYLYRTPGGVAGSRPIFRAPR